MSNQMNELRLAVADILGMDQSWPDHGNAPLAIAATVGILHAAVKRNDEALTANDVLKLVADCAQRCRENGDSDMRIILNEVHGIKAMMKEGKSRTEILAHFEDDEDDEDDDE